MDATPCAALHLFWSMSKQIDPSAYTVGGWAPAGGQTHSFTERNAPGHTIWVIHLRQKLDLRGFIGVLQSESAILSGSQQKNNQNNKQAYLFGKLEC
jgi:hypothetical protein